MITSGVVTSSVRQIHKRVIGFGSNVIDYWTRIKEFPPQAGAKYLFDISPNERCKPLALPGGVILNQLAWIKALDSTVHTSLVAKQGFDSDGRFLRNCMRAARVSTKFVVLDKAVRTSFSVVLVHDESGERVIIMHRGGSADLSPKEIERILVHAFPSSTNVPTLPGIALSEISQVRLDSVAAFFDMAKAAYYLNFLDVDTIAPSNLLGSTETLLDCLRLSNVIKAGLPQAETLVRLLDQRNALKVEHSHGTFEREELASHLALKIIQLVPQSNVVIVTDGSRGAAGAFCTTSEEKKRVVRVESKKVDKIKDTTGAGDAFFGAFVHKTLSRGALPTSVCDLESDLNFSSAVASFCCSGIGGWPASDLTLLKHSKL